jgi:cytochrome b subunit of formate dehydrogenase
MSATFARYIKFSLVITDLIICLSGLIMLITGSVIQGQLNSQYLAKTIGGYSTTAGKKKLVFF